MSIPWSHMRTSDTQGMQFEAAINMITQVLNSAYSDNLTKQRLMKEHILALAKGDRREIDGSLQRIWNFQDCEGGSLGDIDCEYDELV